MRLWRLHGRRGSQGAKLGVHIGVRPDVCLHPLVGRPTECLGLTAQAEPGTNSPGRDEPAGNGMIGW